MPSPFPGMDPYLEGHLWTTIHGPLCTAIVGQLAPKLRPRYLALTNERFVLDMPEEVAITTRGMYPDVGVVRTRRGPRTRNGAAVLEAPLKMATVMPEEVPHFTVEIRDTKRRRLVTMIELLSPTNKRGKPYQKYVRRRERILLSSVHLIEIDLLRKGRRPPMREPLPSDPYFVFVSRAPDVPITEIWPIALDEPLPSIPVPLLRGDPDASLDLQLAVTTIYDLVGYDLAVDYGRPPDVPLDPEQTAWADQLLRAAGKRK